MDKEQIKAISESIPMEQRFSVEQIVSAAIESYKAELLKEVGEPIYQVCKSDSISLSSAWIDVTEQTYNDAGLYPEYGRRILYTSDQVAAAILKATKPLEERRCEICGYAEHHREHTSCLRTQLAAAQEEAAQYKDELAMVLRCSADLRSQLAAAQEENGRLENQVLARDAELWGRTQEILGLKDQLAKAEQRVAEACALQVATEIKFHWLDAARVAKEIRSGEWRKFVKEV